ncbi:MAG: InlB B-repeat-containing protein [Candidatus Izemoplasmatales bacterium]
MIYYTISFETNGGSEIPSQQVQGGFFATRPEDPTKTNFVFSGWFKDENLESIYDFDTEIVTSDITIYASWSSPGDTSIANFYWNYVGAPEEIYFSKVFKNNTRIEDPGTPEREGFYFAGWFIEDGTAYNKLTRYTGNQQFYAKWKQIYIFEAEKTQLTGLMDDIELGLATDTGAKRGYNYSGEANGVNLIKSHSDASGGKYISGLYYRGGYLQFEINSDKAVADATLRLVLSCEYADISLTYKTYKIMVNRTELKYDNNINLGTGAGVSTEPGPRGGFTEIIIGNINLNQGNNVIRLTVNNNQTPAGDPGTVDAASPIVDCIIIYADAALTMTEYPNS